MALIKQKIPIISEPQIASYSYTDIAEGTGVTVFYGVVSETSAGNGYHLTTDVNLYSSLIESDSAVTESESYVKLLDLDFDLSSFNLPKSIKGTAYVQSSVYVDTSAGSGSGYIIAKVRKWDGTTETEIANAQSQTNTQGSGGGTEMVLVPITIPETDFQSGETLRLTIEGWIKTDAGAANDAHITVGHDPRNRDGTNITPSTDDVLTQLILYMPFKLNL